MCPGSAGNSVCCEGNWRDVDRVSSPGVVALLCLGPAPRPGSAVVSQARVKKLGLEPGCLGSVSGLMMMKSMNL